MLKKYEQIIKYVIVGGFTTCVSLLSYYLLTLVLDPKNPVYLQIANIMSWVLAVTFAYFANRMIVFKSNNNKIKEASKFYLSRVSTLLIDMFIMFLLVTIIGINDRISKIIVQFIVLVLNYILSKFLVFNYKSKK